MSIITLVTTCFGLLLVSSFAGANEANVNCLRSIKSGVTDPNGYLSTWVFGNNIAGYICKFSGVTCWHDDENRVLSIKLSGFGLEGEFPSEIIEHCSDLTGLDLSSNNFSGALPTNIASLAPSLTTLDLSDNQFSGEIPTSLSNITFLNTLMLQYNQLTGPLPPELVRLSRLTKFSVAYNQLTGPVPHFNEALKFGRESFDYNKGLCGLPMDPCVDPEEEIIQLGMISAAIGAALFAPLGAFLDWFVFNGRKKKQEDKRQRSWIFHVGE